MGIERRLIIAETVKSLLHPGGRSERRVKDLQTCKNTGTPTGVPVFSKQKDGSCLCRLLNNIGRKHVKNLIDTAFCLGMDIQVNGFGKIQTEDAHN